MLLAKKDVCIFRTVNFRICGEACIICCFLAIMHTIDFILALHLNTLDNKIIVKDLFIQDFLLDGKFI